MKFFNLISVTLLILSTSACDSGSSSGNSAVTTATNELVSVSNGFYNSEITSRDEQGTVTRVFRDVIDTENNLITGYSRDPVTGAEFSDLQFNYNKSGYLTQTDFFNSDGNLTQRNSYAHNALGYLISSSVEDFVNPGDSRNTTYLYNEKNNLAGREFRRTDGTLYLTYGYQRNTNGTISVRTDTRVSGGQLEVQATKRYQYDDQNRVSRTEYDSITDNSFDENTEFQYDANGNVSVLAAFDSAGATKRSTEYGYTAISEPIFNRWIRNFKYFP